MERSRDRPAASLPQPAIPTLNSHFSNSVPSTPHQHPRDTSFRTRTPSPTGDLGSHSPRSVSSEANGPLTTLRKPRQPCKYETSAAFGRRRIQYNIGSDPLEEPKEKPKQHLSKEEDVALTDAMQDMYKWLLPSEESETRRRQLVAKIEGILQDEWPGESFKAHVFGSSGNMLCTSESDVDLCIQTTMRHLESMCMLADVLAKHGMENVVCVASAKVPIVKIWDPQLKLACDMNVNNTLAIENTRMIKTYVQIDERVRALAMIVKHWTRRRILNDAALGGTLSSYTWICMIINFLQTRVPSILPSLHQTPRKINEQTYGIESTFADSLESLLGYGKDNKQSLGQLLFQFFRYYGYEINYEDVVVSVRQGRLLSRKEKGWDASSLSKEGRDRLCVEEPINTSRNLGNSADPTAFRGIHLEIRRAFTLTCDGKLDKVCEQYEFPPEEKITFKKPSSQPRPALLTRSNSQSSKSVKGAQTGRGGRNPLKNNGGNPRRASSGATRPLFTQSPPLGPSGPDPFSQSNLHDHLYQRYQLLQLQQESLKAQAQLMAQAQAQARLQKQAQSSQLPPRSGNSISEGSRSNKQSSPQLVAADRHTQAAFTLFPGYVYHYPSAYEMIHGGNIPATHEGANSNSSSPALAHAVPANRRGLHRNANINELPGGAVRSHSQPARRGPGLAANRMAMPSGYDAHNLAKMAGSISHQNGYDMPMHPNPGFAAIPGPMADINTPMEYLGYYVNEASHLPPHLADTTMRHALPREIAQRRRRVTPELQPPKLSAPFRHASRSPSPLGHYRSFSTGLRTAPLPASSPSSSSHQQQRQRSEDIKSPPEDYRPVIVNGSTPAHVPTTPDRSNMSLSNGVSTPYTYHQHPHTDGRMPVDYPAHFNPMTYDEQFQPSTQYQTVDNNLTSPKSSRGRESGRAKEGMSELEEYQQPVMPPTSTVTNNSPLICSSSTSLTADRPDGFESTPNGLSIQQSQYPSNLPIRNASANASTKINSMNERSNERVAGTATTPLFLQTHTRGHAPSKTTASLKSGLSALDLARARIPSETALARQAIAASGIAGNAVLSPVFETRTPSPSSVRKHDGSTMTNGFKKPPTSGREPDAKGDGNASGAGISTDPTSATITQSIPAIATSNTFDVNSKLPQRPNGITNTPSNVTLAPAVPIAAVATPLNSKSNLPRKENFIVPSIPSQLSNNPAANSFNAQNGVNNNGSSNSNTNPWQRSVGSKKGDRRRSKSNIFASGAVIANGSVDSTGSGAGVPEARARGDMTGMEAGGFVKGG